MTTLKTGLGDRLIPNSALGKFTELPIIDLTRLASVNLNERKALAAEVSRSGLRLRQLELICRPRPGASGKPAE